MDIPGHTLRHLKIPCPQFVGRQEELLWLQERLEDARRGRGELVLIAGEAGIGKSRLLAEFALQANQAHAVVLTGKSSPFESSLPYAPVMEAIRGFLRIRRPAEIATLSDLQSAEIRKLLPELASLLPDVVVNSHLSPSEEKSRLFESLYVVLHNLAGDSPLLLTVEDLHWADPATLEVLFFLARRLRTERWLVVGTYRSEELAPTGGLGRVRYELLRDRLANELPLGPLSEPDIRQLVDGVIGALGPAPAILAAWVFNYGEGNPFFTEEIVRTIVEASDAQGTPLDPMVLPGVSVPPTVREAIAAQVMALSSQPRTVLAAAAVLGRTFDLDTLQRLSGLEGDAFAESFMTLLAAKLLRAERTPLQYGFRHHLIREVVLDTQAPDVRRAFHAHAGALLEARGGPTVSPHLLARHFWEAGDRPRTVQYALRAAAEAYSIYAYEEAGSYFSMALEAAAEGDLKIRLRAMEGLGDARFHGAHLDGAMGAYIQMRQIAEVLDDPSAVARAYRKMITVELERDPERAISLHREALRVLAPIGDPLEEAYIRERLALTHFTRGAFTQGAEEARVALTAAERAADPGAMARAYLTLGLNQLALGERDGVAMCYERALILARQAGDLETEARTLASTAELAKGTGDFPRARELLQQAVALLEKTGLLPTLLFAMDCLAQLAFLEGRWDDAAAMWNRLLQLLARGAERLPYYTVAASWAAKLALLRGRLQEATVLLEDARNVALARGTDSWGLVESLNGLAQVAVRRNDLSEARRLLVEGSTITGAPEWAKVNNLLLLTELHLMEGNDDAARLWFNRVAERTRRLVSWEPWVRRLEGQLAALAGDLELAVHHCEAALGVLAHVPQPYQEALVRYHLGQSLHRRSRRGDRRAARQHLSSALSTFQRLGASYDAELARQALGRIGGRAPRGRDLTEREREVVALLAQGLGNAAIASRLYISIRTVEVHVSHILGKLGLESRAHAAAWAARHAPPNAPIN